MKGQTWKKWLSCIMAAVLLCTSYLPVEAAAVDTAEPNLHKVEVMTTEHGTVAVTDSTQAYYTVSAQVPLSLDVVSGERISITVAAEEGYQLEGMIITYADGTTENRIDAEKEIEVRDDLSVKLTFAKVPEAQEEKKDELEAPEVTEMPEVVLNDSTNDKQEPEEKAENQDAQETNVDSVFPSHEGEKMEYVRYSNYRTVATTSLSVIESGGVIKYSSDETMNTRAKYVVEDGKGDMEGKWRMAYCLEYQKDTPQGSMGWDGTGMVKKEIAYCLTYGVRYWEKPAVWTGYRTGIDWKADYWVTSMAIHILNGEFTLDKMLGTVSNTAVKNALTKLVNDARNSANYTGFNGSQYQGNTYTLAPATQNAWHQESNGGQSGYATDWYRQDYGNETYGSSKEYIDAVSIQLNNAPAGAKVVRESDKTYAAFKIWLPEVDYQRLGGTTITATVAGKVPSYMSGWCYLPASSNWQKVTVFEGAAYENFTKTVNASVPVQNGRVKIKKVSSNPEFTENNSCYSLAGAEYGLYSDSGCNNLIKTLITDEDGNTEEETVLAGTYYVKELKAPKGFLLDPNVQAITVKVNETAAVSLKEEPLNDPVSIMLRKLDQDTNAENPLGSAALVGAEFTVKYYPGYYKTADDLQNVVHGRSWVLKTNSNGVIMLAEKYKVSGDDFYKNANGIETLPLGTVTIQETAAPEGYLLNDTLHIQQIRPGEKGDNIVEYNPPTVLEQVRRGDLKLIKAEEKTQKRMANVRFRLTSKTSGEAHEFVTDENGYYSTESTFNKHSHNTNEGKSSADGIWFGSENPDDSLGALPYDTYTLEELPCEANEGYKLISFDVTIRKDAETVDLGTVTNALIPVPGIATYAGNKDTGTQDAFAEKEVTIVDQVNYWNLDADTEYKLQGILMDEETGKVLTVDGKTITAEKTFTTKETSGSVTMEFPFEGSGLEGKSIVIFEKLYLKDREIAVHEDLADEDQTIVFLRPEIKTYAAELSTGAKEINAAKVTVVDQISYTNLQIGKKYKMKGTLMNKSTGEPVLVKKQPVVSEKTFTAPSRSGSVELEFSFDATDLAGQELVAFEKLYYGKTVIAVHEDINDADQTVSVLQPKIITHAGDQSTGLQEGYVEEYKTVVDKVTYTGLQPGREYTVKGTLMDKETGKVLLDHGKKVTSETTFKAEASSGSVQLEFLFDATDLAGKALVVFENLYSGKAKIAAHEDINDTDQTVSIKKPEITTNASNKATGTQEGIISDSITIVDRVEYTGLIPGIPYQVQGVLMDKETGKEFMVNGKTVTVEKTFTAEAASGSIDLEFTFAATGLSDKELVAFEKLYYQKTVIAVHEDINDAKQTVVYKKAKEKTVTLTSPKSSNTTTLTSSTPVKTGDTTPIGWYLILAGVALFGILAVIVVQKHKKSTKNK